MKLHRVEGMAVREHCCTVGNIVALLPREKGMAVDIVRTAGKN